MGGKTSQSSSQVAIPPEVLARYNSVNATAQQAASQPFQRYGNNPSDFVAPLTPEQNAGISTINQASGMVNPLYQNATSAASNAYTAAQPQLTAASNTGQWGLQQGQSYLGQAGQAANAGFAAAQPMLQGAAQTSQAGYANAQPFLQDATQTAKASYANAQPFQKEATGFALAGGQAVDPSQITGSTISQY